MGQLPSGWADVTGATLDLNKVVGMLLLSLQVIPQRCRNQGVDDA